MNKPLFLALQIVVALGGFLALSQGMHRWNLPASLIAAAISAILGTALISAPGASGNLGIRRAAYWSLGCSGVFAAICLYEYLEHRVGFNILFLLPWLGGIAWFCRDSFAPPEMK